MKPTYVNPQDSWKTFAYKHSTYASASGLICLVDQSSLYQENPGGMKSLKQYEKYDD
jgi:hypothetical protein